MCGYSRVFFRMFFLLLPFCCLSLSPLALLPGTLRYLLPYRRCCTGAGASSVAKSPNRRAKCPAPSARLDVFLKEFPRSSRRCLTQPRNPFSLALHSLGSVAFSASGSYTYASRRSMISATISPVRHPPASPSNFRRTYTLRTPP